MRTRTFWSFFKQEDIWPTSLRALGCLIIYLFVHFLDGHYSWMANLFLIVSFCLFIWLTYKAIVYFRSEVSAPSAQNISHHHHGSARWSNRGELEADGYSWNGEGLWIGDGVFRKKLGSLLTIASTRQGKGTSVIIPNLLIDPLGSYVITDPKGENAFITAAFQQEAGQKVYILDPWDEQGKMGAEHEIKAAGFNPFDFLHHQPDELRDNCDLIAYYLVPDNPNAKDPYWDDRARTLIRICLMHIVTSYPEDEQNFWTLYKMLRVSGANLVRLFVEMKENTTCDEIISLAAEEFLGLDPTGATLPGILSSAQKATTIFESPQLKRSLAKSDFNPYDLANGNCTVYVVIPERYLESHATWLRMVIGLSLKAINARPNRPVYFLLDEFPVLGKMQEVIRAYAFGAGQNIRMWTFSQSLSLLKDIYGEDGLNSLISNVSVFQAFGVTDPYSQEFISKALGEETRTKETTSQGSSDSNSGSSSSHNVSRESFARRLMTAEEVGKCPFMILMTQSTKTTLVKLPYYQRRFEIGIKHTDPRLTKEEKDIVKKGGKISEWSEFFEERASPPPRIYS